MNADAPLRLVVLISGRGSNLHAILDAIRDGSLPAQVVAVISNRPAAAGLTRPAQEGIPTEVLDHQSFPDRDAYDQALMEQIDRYDPGLVVLAGFMRILTPQFVRHYAGRLVNIHPSLLPRYRGLNTHARALEAGEREHGASVHFVTEDLDGGPVFLQAKVLVEPDDSPESLAARVLSQEHRLYPEAIRRIAEGRIHWKDEGIWMDGRPLDQPPLLNTT
jgi:phosphoribosylglycinamide formyltransferase-1